MPHDFAHLAPISVLFDRVAAGETVLATASAPPESALAALVKEGLGRVLRARPGIRVGYCSYDRTRAMADLRGCGFDIEKLGALEPGQVRCFGVGAALAGSHFDVIVVNEPIQDARYATQTFLERLRGWLPTLLCRAQPHGSVLALGSRWCKRDALGQLVAEHDFARVNIPALSPEGASYWPTRHPVAALEKTRQDIGPVLWAALYQGEPIEDTNPPRPEATPGGVATGDLRILDEARRGLVPDAVIVVGAQYPDGTFQLHDNLGRGCGAWPASDIARDYPRVAGHVTALPAFLAACTRQR